MTSKGAIGCVGDGEVCEEGNLGHCDGHVAVTCRGGRVSRFDCATEATEYRGLGTCRMLSDDGPTCGRANAQCDAAAPFSETCQDGIVTFCLLGEIRTIDCKHLGFSGCQMVAWPNPSRPVAAYCSR